MIVRFHCVASLLLLASQSAIAAAPADLNRQIASIRTVNDIALSPDGKTVAALISDSTEAGGQTHIWITSAGAAPRQVTGSEAAADSADDGPAWTPDGRAIVYLQHAHGTTTLRRIELGSGASETLRLGRNGAAIAAGWGTPPSASELAVRGFALAPSGAIAVWASAPADAAERAARKEDEHRFGVHEPVRLYLIDSATGAREIALPDDVRGVTWSRDGRRLLVVTKPASDDLGASNRLWLIENGAPPREILGTAENVQSATWLADGRIAYFARCSRDAPIVCRDLFVQGLDGTEPRNLTGTITGSLIAGADNAATSGPVVAKSGELLVTVARSFGQDVALIRVSDGRVRWIDHVPAVVRAVASNADRTAFALLAAERGGPPAVYLTDPDFHAHMPLAVPPLLPPGWEPLRARRLQWSSDGQLIDGLLYLPAGATPDHRVPLVVDVHGGPAGRFEDSEYPLVRLLLAQGWAVLHVNPRGSFGYGGDFLAALKDDLGGADYRDIHSGIDAALTDAPLDPSKLAMIGYSYGATIVSFTLGRSDRFKALVAAAPVVDQISEYGTEASSWYDRWYFGQPWRELERAWRQSPLSGVSHARTPLLLLHGESDPVNPLGQSLELHRALQQEGAPVELLLFPRETHHELGQNYYGFPSVEPHHGMALRERIVTFLGDAFSGKPDAGLQTH